MQTDRYSPPAIAMHWLAALLIVGLFALGLYLGGLPLSPSKFKLIAWHKWLGILVLALTALRLGYRFAKGAPPLPAHLQGLMRTAAHAGHSLLYLLMLAIPLTGWLMSSAYGFPVVLFKLWTLPDLVGRNEALGDLLMTVHSWLNWTLAACVVGHLAAAVKHHFVDRDGTLWRMSPHAPRR
ncbi:cytochrome b [Neisseriaceae bacterium JH1-16]|nr:cytochrome b [Neisseriaceae bacterium JH1-16]